MPTDSERDQSTDLMLKAALRQNAAASAGEACVDAETFAAWADGALSDADAARVEAHVADCARCQSVMASFAASEPAGAAASAAPVVIPFRPKPAMTTLRWLIPAAAGTIAATLLIWTAWPKPEPPAPVSADTTMAKAMRPTQAPVPTPAPSPADQAFRDEMSSMLASRAAKSTRANQALAKEERRSTPRQTTGTVSDATSKPAAPPPAPVTLPLPASTAAAAAPPPPPQVQSQGLGAVRTEVPTVSQTVGADFIQKLPRADRNALSFLVFMPGMIEFGPPDSRSSTVTGLPIGGMGRGGAGGRGAAGAGGGRAAVTAERAAPASIVRWRILPTGEVGKTTNGGESWVPIDLDPQMPVTNGSAPSSTVCWLIGRGGAVLLSTDGLKFTRLPFPEVVDLRSITATSAREASVTTATGRMLTTTDGGQTWK